MHTIKATTALLIVSGSLFCVLFGQGTHFHGMSVHINDHLDIRVHIHAHEYQDAPFQGDTNHKKHEHEVSTASDIAGMLTSQPKVQFDLKKHTVLSLNGAFNPAPRNFDDFPAFFGLPPPGKASSHFHLFSSSHRGPPLA